MRESQTQLMRASIEMSIVKEMLGGLTSCRLVNERASERPDCCCCWLLLATAGARCAVMRHDANVSLSSPNLSTTWRHHPPRPEAVTEDEKQLLDAQRLCTGIICLFTRSGAHPSQRDSPALGPWRLVICCTHHAYAVQ